MTPEQQRIKIAEACGWTITLANIMEGWKPVIRGTHPKNRNAKAEIYVPDYCNDLNAMAEAEKLLPKDKIPEYEYLLTELANSAGMGLRRYFVGEVFRVSRCTAKQRADAFCAVLGLDK